MFYEPKPQLATNHGLHFLKRLQMLDLVKRSLCDTGSLYRKKYVILLPDAAQLELIKSRKFIPGGDGGGLLLFLFAEL